MRRIAVTGGTGFIGAALIDQLIANGFEVRALARNAKRVKRAGEIEIVEEIHQRRHREPLPPQ